MTVEESELAETRWRRIRRVKKWLRPLPRRATLHRYPILKLFAESARKRIYIWSFRAENAVPAIYAGCILSLMPLFGLQIIGAFLLALWLRANLPILVGLQFISNPITVFPILFTTYRIGRNCLGLFGVEVDRLTPAEVGLLIDHFIHGAWGEKFDQLFIVFSVTSLGALVLGSFFGLLGSILYRIVANRTAASYSLLRRKISQHKTKQK
jgi:uncharacterized protein